MVRIQVLVDEKERETFRQLAEKEGLSLSGWLRRLATERAEHTSSRNRIGNLSELERFFRACDRREKGSGREPDWNEHLKVMERSRGEGRS